MFKVEVDSLDAYFGFDPARRGDLEQLDGLIRSTAPGLTRYFHAGTPAGEPGMRFKMIGYGPFEYLSRSGKPVQWPVIGVALQKNYISVYVAGLAEGQPVTERFRGRLGELRMGSGNFSFVRFGELNREKVEELVREVGEGFGTGRAGSVVAP